jgi:hypothetical protein
MMRIISNFHDYYDGVMKYGVDHLNIYKRKEKVISIPFENTKTAEYKKYFTFFELLDTPNPYRFYIGTPGNNLKYSFILFAGELYPVISFFSNHYYSYIDLMTNEKIHKFCEERELKYFKKFFDVKEIEEKIIDYQIKVKSPIVIFNQVYFRCDGHKLTLNGKLKDYSFFKVVDPFQAYQKIEMFTTNHLIDIMPVKEIADIDKVVKHGFDKKSFRRM